MSKIVAQSIFSETLAQRNWQTYVTSGVVHGVVIGVAFLITFPAVQVLEDPVEQHVTLVAPILPKTHPTVQAPRIQHKPFIPTPQPSLAKAIPPPVLPKPKPIEPKIVPPVTPPVVPEPPQIVAEVKPALPAPPTAKAEPVRKQVIVGGFGDPQGVNPADHPATSPVLMARVGSFDSPQGAGNSGGGGHLDAGSVRNSGFGGVSAANIAANGRAALVRTGNFGDAAASVPQRKQAEAAVAPTTPVEILFKPRPAYSPEAREMHIEGQVSLQVVFQGDGSVRVVRVIRGLGHGLDEAAEQAAQRVRFKPATRSGAPVDTDATISITFELT